MKLSKLIPAFLALISTTSVFAQDIYIPKLTITQIWNNTPYDLIDNAGNHILPYSIVPGQTYQFGPSRFEDSNGYAAYLNKVWQSCMFDYMINNWTQPYLIASFDGTCGVHTFIKQIDATTYAITLERVM